MIKNLNSIRIQLRNRMKFIKFLLVSSITVAAIYLLDHPQQMGSTSIPAMGKFLSPFTGFWSTAETKADFQDQTYDLEIFDAPVRIIYDDRLVPHIFAESLEDAIAAQGFVTAKYRLWQMDISTRSTGGRLSEILGEKVLERDQLQRRKGLLFAAENAVKGWKKNPKVYNYAEKYAAGVNAYVNALNDKSMPFEFKLLNYKPEEWTTLKTALFTKAMAQSLCMRESDLETTNAYQHFGQEVFDFLYPEYNPKQSPIIPAEIKFDFAAKIQSDTNSQRQTPQTGMIPHTPYAKPPPFLGSNNWAVTGEKTRTGNPILCSDPHLGLSLPSIWYEVHLVTPKMNVYGVSLPGLPGVIMGFNEHAAWGMTNVGHDMVDWYQIEWKDESRTQYILDGKTVDVENRIETYHLKDGTTILDTVKYTVWGPVVYESDDHPYSDLAMRWIGHDEASPEEIDVFVQLDQVSSYEEYNAALENYESPAQNVVFATKKGDIAIHPSGKFPIKKDQQGRMVQTGNTSDNAWQGFIPNDHKFKVKNPSSNYVGSANQRTTHQDYPYYYNGGFDDYRGRYLHRQLDKMDNITVKDMMALQNDNYSIEAEELLQLLLQNLDRSQLDKAQRAILLTLEDWKYNFEADLVAPTFYDVWTELFYKQTWDEIYNETHKNLLKPELWRTIALLEDNPNHEFFDIENTPIMETAKDICTQTFIEMSKQMEERKNNDQHLTWADFKATQVTHLGQIPALSVQNIPIGGYHHALNAVREDFGPSWRMVVELGDQINAFGIFPGGQSGNPSSQFYDNMIEDWAKGDYQQLLFVKEPDELLSNQLFEETFN